MVKIRCVVERITYHFAETGVAGRLSRLASTPAEDRLYTRIMSMRAERGSTILSIDPSVIEKRTGMEYEDIQKEAIRTAAASKIMILTGGPGTKKALSTAVRNVTVSKRNTMLRERLS